MQINIPYMDPMADAFPFVTLGLINILPFESTGVQMSIFAEVPIIGENSPHILPGRW